MQSSTSLVCLINPRQEIPYGRLSFHPIPCGTALFGHVTSGATYTAYSQVGSASHSRSHSLVSCLTVGLSAQHGTNYILSAVVRDVV